MYLVGLGPNSTEAVREIELLKRRLFSACAHPSFLALPPVALAWASDEPADFRSLDAVVPDDRVSGEPAPTYSVDRKTGEVFLVPPPDLVLARAWQGLAAVRPGAASETRWPHRPRAAIFLGFAGSEKIDAALEAIPSSLSPVRNFAITVYKVATASSHEYWSAMTWEIVYQRLLGRAR